MSYRSESRVYSVHEKRERVHGIHSENIRGIRLAMSSSTMENPRSALMILATSHALLMLGSEDTFWDLNQT